jgi:GntR family transcriptional regulator
VFTTTPLYEQVRRVLVAKIMNGIWKPGQVIENEIDLAKEYGVSVGTMRKALLALETEGLLHRHQGRGTFVADPSSDSQRAKFEKLFREDGRPIASTGNVQQIECRVGEASQDDLTHLDVRDGEQIVQCRQIVSVDDKPCVYREAHVPRQLVPDADVEETWDVFDAAKRYGFHLGRVAEKLYLKRASLAVATALGVEEGIYLLVVDRVIFSFDGKPVEWLLSWSQFTDMYYGVMLG